MTSTLSNFPPGRDGAAQLHACRLDGHYGRAGLAWLLSLPIILRLGVASPNLEASLREDGCARDLLPQKPVRLRGRSLVWHHQGAILTGSNDERRFVGSLDGLPFQEILINISFTVGE